MALHGFERLSAPRMLALVALGASCALLGLGTATAQAASLPSDRSAYLQVAEQGVAIAKSLWADPRGWYDNHLGDHERYPLATIWDAAPLFEALDAIALAAPTPGHRVAVAAFAQGAERYWDGRLRPVAGYAPYPNDRGPHVKAWFDDNGWWGLAFLDAYQATGTARYLRDAERAFAFIASQGWDRAHGGFWWNTYHPYKAGEPLAAGSLLGALLYRLTGKAAYRVEVERFLAWADRHFVAERGLYKRTAGDPTPTPYVEGPLVEAHQVLCEAAVTAACSRAHALADAAWQRFQDRLNMGPQFDTIYLHWMLIYATQTHDGRWPALAREMASRALTKAADGRGLYLRAWDGGSIVTHQARPNMLQTDAATLELFAWLAAVG